MKNLAFLACFATALCTQAQNEFYVNGGTVTVQAGALLYVDGDITITGGGIVTNEGIISLTGDWTNNVAGGLTDGGGSTNTVQFVGTGIQIITGSQSTVFNNLTFSGPTSVQLNVNTSAGGSGSGLLALNSTELNLNSRTMTITNPLTGAITRSTGYVLSENQPPANYGFLDWQVGANAATYTIPFATAGGTTYIPFIFTVNTAGTVSTTGSLAVATYPTNPVPTPNNLPWPNTTVPMTDAFGTLLWPKIADRFWIANYAGYSVNPASTYTFTYSDADIGLNNTLIEPNLQAIYWGGLPAGWQPYPLGTDAPGVNQVNGVFGASGINISAPWLLLDPAGQVLPITLLTFDAEPVDNNFINVHWTTANEVDNRGFELQRSIDRVNFETISWIDGSGNSSTLVNYGYDDREVNRNVIYYYRLKQLSFDGSVTYSNIDAASITGDESMLIGEFYPNPTNNLSSIDIYSPDDRVVSVEVFDGLGRMVKVSQAYIATGSNTMSLNLDEFAHGAYMVRLGIAGDTYTKRVVKLQ